MFINSLRRLSKNNIFKRPIPRAIDYKYKESLEDSEVVKDYVKSLNKDQNEATVFSGEKALNMIIDHGVMPVRNRSSFVHALVQHNDRVASGETMTEMVDVIKNKIKENPERKDYYEKFYADYRQKEINKKIHVELAERDFNRVYDQISLDRPSNPGDFLRFLLNKIHILPEMVLSQDQKLILESITSKVLGADEIKRINQLCKNEFNDAKNLYINGQYQEAFEIFSRLASEHSHGLSHIFLGEMYYNGSGDVVKQDFKKAFNHFKHASLFNIPVAFGMLGELYYKGLVQPEGSEYSGDTDQERKSTYPIVYFTIASNLKLKSSIEQLSFMYMELKNNHGAIHHLKRLAEYHNDMNAITTIGALLLEEYPEFAKDLWLFAGKMGDSNALCNLGRYYYSNDTPDYNNALLLWEAAAQDDHAEAQFYLGGMYQQGLVVERNFKKAYELYDKSAKGGNSNAQFLIGKAYYEGEDGLKINKNYGLNFLKASAANSNELAIDYLNNLNIPITNNNSEEE